MRSNKASAASPRRSPIPSTSTICVLISTWCAAGSTGALLLLSDQGREFSVRLPAETWVKTAWFDVCVFLWAFQSWYWARLLLDLTFGDRDAPLAHPRAGRLRTIIIQTPRVLAAGSYLVAVAICLLAGT